MKSRVETAEYIAKSKTGKNIFILNPSPVDKNYDYSQILKSVDILMPNEVELSQLADMEIKEIEDVREASAKLLSKGVKNMVVTLGKKGVFIKNSVLSNILKRRMSGWLILPEQAMHLPGPSCMIIQRPGIS